MKILKNKRGIALENAILFMIVIFSLCFLLASFTLIGHYQAKIENAMLTQRVDIDQIGEDYLASVGEGKTFSKSYDNYSYKVEGNALIVWRGTDKTNVVLYVEVNDGSLAIWSYSLPTTETE